MPYRTVSELPTSVKENLPAHAEAIYRKAFNSAWEQYKDPKKRILGGSREAVARRVAWTAVKQVYRKDEQKGKWVKKAG